MKTVLVGFDAFDPVIFEKLHSEGKTPNLSRFVDAGGYSRFSVSNPPQSEVSWTSIATGMNPGEHGIFDFVHRNPVSYGRQVSLLPTKTNALGRQFVPPHSSPTVFDAAVEDGYPGISLWWPATFPARLESPVWSIPGLGTPDIFGRLGVGIFYSMDDGSDGKEKTRIEQMRMVKKGHFSGELEGPVKMTLTGAKDTRIQFDLKIKDERSGDLVIGKNVYELAVGAWSPFIEFTFKIGFGIAMKAVTRAILTQSSPEPQLYFLPLQIHPLRSPWPYGTPKRFIKNVWNRPGPFLTLGWPQDTTGLEEKFITDEQFLTLCDQICDHREQTLMWMLDSYQEGVLACIFDSLDRVQHMFLRDRDDVIEKWYIKLDALFGRIQTKIRSKSGLDDTHLMVVSDHGFGEFNYKVNLNKWLLNQGFLQSTASKGENNLNHVDWEKSQAYAIGLNSLYLNMEGREGQGTVSQVDNAKKLQEIKDRLLNWKGPNGKQVVRRVLPKGEVFQGPYTEYGPDIIVGYNPGYRASAQTGLGEWAEEEIEINRDHWGADHCFAAETVPGVLFSSAGLTNYPSPSYKDIPRMVINKEITPRAEIDAPSYSDEDQEKVEERLKELGYL
ncbi:MAG: alkaline phosphatase family protein [Anaerolineales bacterium]|nr:alkaline phosphatase family protein [Anaerolineales bacterium]